MTEGRRTTNEDTSGIGELPMPIQYPHIGSSIGRKDSEAIGTLGGYVQIDGEIMGITNHHVAIGTRLEAFPTAEEELSGVTFEILQPAERDLHTRIASCEVDLEEELNEATAKRKKEPTSSYEVENKELQIQKRQIRLKELEIQLKELRSWTPERCVLGSVWKTSGLRAREAEKFRCFRLDWALIKLSNTSRFQDPKNLVNEVKMVASYIILKISLTDI